MWCFFITYAGKLCFVIKPANYAGIICRHNFSSSFSSHFTLLLAFKCLGWYWPRPRLPGSSHPSSFDAPAIIYCFLLLVWHEIQYRTSTYIHSWDWWGATHAVRRGPAGLQLTCLARCSRDLHRQRVSERESYIHRYRLGCCRPWRVPNSFSWWLGALNSE